MAAAPQVKPPPIASIITRSPGSGTTRQLTATDQLSVFRSHLCDNKTHWFFNLDLILALAKVKFALREDGSALCLINYYLIRGWIECHSIDKIDFAPDRDFRIRLSRQWIFIYSCKAERLLFWRLNRHLTVF